MVPPDYKNGNIVNLVSSLAQACGEKTPYPLLDMLSSSELENSMNIILMVVDGLGFEYLIKRKEHTVLKDYLRGKLISVFPPTTAAALTTFASGWAPQQHAVTGWFMHLKELGCVTAVLPFVTKIGKIPLQSDEIKLKDIFYLDGFLQNITLDSYTITHSKISDSEYNKLITPRAKILGYSSLTGFFMQLRKVLTAHTNRKFIYAYWPEFDSISHKHGSSSKKAEEHFKEFDKKLGNFLKRIKNTHTTIVLTSDHGMIDITNREVIWLDNHPRLKECLTLPFCGEPRVVYCYVHPSKTHQFERYVESELNTVCTLRESTTLIDDGYFGLYNPNPKLTDRIGDYTLIMKDHYVFLDKPLQSKKEFNIGNHGGVSVEEMLVPLVVINT
jgi:predicted AlkP superfamily pyrophosphatase or phosphodiesterase